MARKKQAKDYRALKKTLNKYHNFSFKMPKKGQDFTPAQKAAITRQFNKLGGLIKQLGERKSGGYYIHYVPNKKGKDYSSSAGVKTNKGLFVEGNVPIKAVKEKVKSGNFKLKYTIRELGQVTFFDFAFPKDILNKPETMELHVENAKAFLIKKYKRMKYMGTFFLRKLSHVVNPTNKFSADILFLYLEEERARRIERRETFKHKNVNDVGAILGFTIAMG